MPPPLGVPDSGLPSGPSTHFAVGDCVWTPCANHGFQLSTIVNVETQNGCYLVEPVESGSRCLVDPADIRPYFNTDEFKTSCDNTEMVHVDDANILENLRRRYLQDEIYTYTANVLLAVNPYKSMGDLYSREKLADYRGKNLGALPPHPFAIADTAYRYLLRMRQNQALVISGESGAGKTETAKVTMHYLTNISRTDASVGSQVQERIMSSNPILESFGNASTVRNQNSSRFGKYNEMFFDGVGSLLFAGIRTYLLESSRVVSVQDGERNFHVFYEMLAGLDEAALGRLHLQKTGHYKMLHSGGAEPVVPGTVHAEREKGKFDELVKAMDCFIENDARVGYWELAAALIHLGEVEFVDTTDSSSSSGGADGSPVSGSPTSHAETDAGGGEPKVDLTAGSRLNLEYAAELLGISQGGLEQALKFKEMKVKGKAHIFSPRTHSQAMQTLQSIIKILYKRLFDNIVERINACSFGKASIDRHRSIGTLDIYGFERLQINSFEQLCINLANERLQQFFIEEVLDAEQRVYEEEGLRIQRLPLPDNLPVVSSVQAIMRILDEHSLRSSKGLVGEGADAKFCEHVHKDQIQNRRQGGRVMALKINARDARAGTAMRLYDGFQIRHYAGDVTYTTKGWIEKNNDALVPGVEALLDESGKVLPKSMVDKKRMEAASTKDSVSHNYLSNLGDLRRTLQKCTVHYIRCFNPNNQKKSGVFMSKYVLEQVIQCGTVELVKIMHHGFPNRCNLKELRARFSEMLPPDFDRYNDGEFMWAIMTAFDIPRSEWTLGNRRLFLKAGQLKALENLREVGSAASNDVIQRIRSLFVIKKVRRVCVTVRVAFWWQRHARKQRTKIYWKAVFFACRAMSWVHKARVKLYGKPDPIVVVFTKPAAPEEKELEISNVAIEEEIFPATEMLPKSHFADTFVTSTSPKLFVALNACEEPPYAKFLFGDLDMRKPIGDEVLRMWQRATTESVILHSGDQIVTAKLNPKIFLDPHSSEQETNQACGLEDFRHLDAHETGKAIAVGIVPPWHIPRITCMCQHRRQKQTFATCDDAGVITVWRWLGTASEEIDKPALRVLGALRREMPDQVLHLCFLSSDVAPKRVVDMAGTVIAVLAARRGALWIDLFSVFQASFRLECTQRVDVERPEYDPDAAIDVSFIVTTHSERVLVLGGRGLLKLWQISVTEEPQARGGGKIFLEPLEDLTSIFVELKGSILTSCLSVPLQALDNRKPSDYLVCGDDAGKLYGFKLDVKDDGRYHISDTPGSCGRFRTNTHTTDVPIRQLVGCYGLDPETQHKEAQQGGMPYGRFLNKVPIQHNLFYSLGDDGVLLAWRFLERGWRSAPMGGIPVAPQQEVLSETPVEQGVVAHVVMDHIVSDELQLTLRIGDQVVIVEEVQGWAGGYKVDGEGKSGWFPRACVREVVRPSINAETPQTRRAALACHGSRLLPNLLVFFDRNAGRFQCYDALKEFKRQDDVNNSNIGGG